MPGTPPNTPRGGIPRFAQVDIATFAPEIDAIVDQIDSAFALLSELTTETSSRTSVDAAEMAARIAADTAEASTRSAADAAEITARQNGDAILLVHVATMDDQTSPPQPAGSVVGHVPVTILNLGGTEVWSLVGALSRAIVAPSGASSVYKIQTDHGHGDGSLADVHGLTAITPVVGRYALVSATDLLGAPAPAVLSDHDTVAVTLVTPGTTKGISVALLFRRTV